MISFFAGANVIAGVVFLILFLLLHTTVFWLLIYILTLSVHNLGFNILGYGKCDCTLVFFFCRETIF